MLSPLFGVESLAREPKGFEQHEAPWKPDRLERAAHPREQAADRPHVKALPTREGRTRATSSDDVEAA